MNKLLVYVGCFLGCVAGSVEPKPRTVLHDAPLLKFPGASPREAVRAKPEHVWARMKLPCD